MSGYDIIGLIALLPLAVFSLVVAFVKMGSSSRETWDDAETGQWHKMQPDNPTDCSTRERGWMQTAGGHRFYPLDPRPDDVQLHDIAHGLAMTCRYGGHTKRFYSVAEHCVHVSRIVEQHAQNAGLAPATVLAYAREALLHDSAEAYIGDMIRPLKHQPEMSEFRRAEAAIEIAVFDCFRVVSTPESHAAIKQIDDRILVDEIMCLMADPDMYLAEGLGKLSPLGVTLYTFSPAQAEDAFLERFNELFG